MSKPPHIVELDARLWVRPVDFYNAVLEQIGAPTWHGRNVNALMESLVFDGISEMEPPFIVNISNLDLTRCDIVQEIRIVQAAIGELCDNDIGRDVRTQVQIVAGPRVPGFGHDKVRKG